MCTYLSTLSFRFLFDFLHVEWNLGCVLPGATCSLTVYDSTDSLTVALAVSTAL